MKLLSLWEPWATLMAIGAKKIETRSWGTSYRGWLAIQASKGGLSKSDLEECLRDPAFRLAMTGEAICPGCIVAVVRLIDCCPMEDTICLPGVFRNYPGMDTQQERAFGDFSEGRWAWVTKDLFRLPASIPFRAKQGLCSVDDATVAQIREQFRSALCVPLESLA